jgi:uncharacterized damage-inducible protein DinB
MSERIQQIKKDLAEARAWLDYVLDRVGERWDTQVYSDGAQWTVKQLAIHLMLSDKGQTRNIQSIAQGGEGVPADFDLQRYNKNSVEKRAEISVDEIRSALAASRAERDAWLDTLDDATLEKKGRHASMRILSIAEILDVMANHERTHAEDIARVLGITQGFMRR